MNKEALPSLLLPFVASGLLLASTVAMPTPHDVEKTGVRIEGNIVSALACRGICIDGPAPAEIDPWKNNQEPTLLPIHEPTPTERWLHNIQRVFSPA